MTRPTNAYQHPPEPLIDWSKAPAWAQAAVMNSKGTWFWIKNADAYPAKDFWLYLNKLEPIAGIGMASDTTKWRDSKVLRPNIIESPTLSVSLMTQTLGRAKRKPKPDWSTAPEDATHYDTLRNWFVNVDDCTGLVSIYDAGNWQPRCWLHRDTVTGNPDRFIQHPDDWDDRVCVDLPIIASVSAAESEGWLQRTLNELEEFNRPIQTERTTFTATGTITVDGKALSEWSKHVHAHAEQAQTTTACGELPTSLKSFNWPAPEFLSLPLTGDYASLSKVLGDAFDQAASGKGAERHGQDLPFDQQPMQRLIELYGLGFALGQAGKKMQESQRLGHDAAIRELLGAINYIAGAVVYKRNNENIPF